MFLNSWNYLRGYVTIEVKGFSIERFLNMAVYKGIFIWDVIRMGASADMKVSVKAFKLLRPIARKTGCKIRIKRKTGLPFVAFRYRKRKFLAFGLLLFIAAMYALSSFVWLVEVEGCRRVPPSDILEFLAERGFESGSFKPGVNTRGLEQAILLSFPDVSWVDIEIKGTRATVHMAETITKKELIDRTTPCDVYAKSDGLIMSMATSAGTPKVKIGDVVKAGDLLVSAEVLVGTAETEPVAKYVHAASRVMAKLYYEISIDVPLEYEIKNYTGKTLANYSIMVHNTELYVLEFGVPYESFTKTRDETRLSLGNSNPLPLSFCKDSYLEYVVETKTRTLDEAKEYGNRLLSSRIMHELPLDAEVIAVEISFTELGDALRLDALVTTVETISEQRAIVEETETDDEQTNGVMD